MIRRCLLSFFSLATLTFAGCDSQKLAKGRQEFYRGEYAAAEATLAPLAQKEGRNQVLYAMEQGTVLHAAGRLDESNVRFLEAAERIKEWETKSLSKEAVALAYSDIAKPYRGDPHEQLLVHTHLMMNFFVAGRVNDALVEARRTVEILDTEGRPDYAEDPFTRFLAALAFDIRGAADDAIIELKKTQELCPAFPYAKAPLLRLARASGRAEELAQWKDLPGPAADFAPGGGILVAFIQTGGSPRKVRRDLFVPPHYRLVAPDLENRPQTTRTAVLKAGGFQASAFLLTDVEKIAHATLEARLAATIAKETGRQIGMECIAQTIEKNRKNGDLLADLFRAAYFVLRVADTRAWETLPARLHVAVLPLPAGTYDVEICFLPQDLFPLGISPALGILPLLPMPGAFQNVTFPSVRIQEGRYTFIAGRGF